MKTRKPRGRPAHPDILTPTEWKIADWVRHGLTNPQIAARHGISLDAVKYHVANILGKLGMRSRSELRQWQGIAADSTMSRSKVMQQSPGFGKIGQIARSVEDIEQAGNWYRDVLGLTPLFEAGTLAFFDCGGVRLMLAEGESAAESVIYFSVNDLHGELDRLKDRGARIISAAHRIHTHNDGKEEWMGFVADNEDRPIGLMAVVHPA